MYGKGCAGSTASGVRTGKIWCRKRVNRRACSFSVSSLQRTRWMPSSASAGATSSWKQAACRAMSSRERAQIISRTSRGWRPEADRVATPVAIRRLRPATRTMKNSSRLLAKIARKFARSRRGVVGSSASSSTRSLNASQLRSRSRNRPCGSVIAVLHRVLVRVEVGVEVGLQVGDVGRRRCAAGARRWIRRTAAGAARVPGRLAGSWPHCSVPEAGAARRREPLSPRRRGNGRSAAPAYARSARSARTRSPVGERARARRAAFPEGRKVT